MLKLRILKETVLRERLLSKNQDGMTKKKIAEVLRNVKVEIIMNKFDNVLTKKQ